MRGRVFALLVVVALVPTAGAVLVPTAGAATPSSGTIGSSSVSVSWQGQHYATGATTFPEECPPALDPANALCDHFFLTVADPGTVEVAISWPSADNDFDLYVYDANGNVVGQSAQGGTDNERLVFDADATTYEVRVNPWLVLDSAYSGRAAWTAPVAVAPNPKRSTGGLEFGPATVIDAQRTEGEPINHVDRGGNYWESGPWGTSTAQSFVHRSTDNGDSFHIVSPIGLRPDTPPGGGDTDIVTDDQRTAYFVDLEGLVNLGVAVSNDDGNTWAKNAFAVQSTLDDRQWFAVDNGTTGAANDNTVFLAFRQVPLGSSIYSSPGSSGPADPIGGLVYTDSTSTPGLPVSTGAPCGQLHFDPVKRNLYYPCSNGDHVEITVGHVAPGQRTGIVYANVQAPASPGGGPVGDIFPAVATDAAGNLYAVWVDASDHNVYYAASADAGQTWGPVRQVNGNDANSNVFSWAVGGVAGRLAIVWYGTASHGGPNELPSWYVDPHAATRFPWFGYASLVTDAAGASPSFAQQRFTHKPMHYGQICTGGLGCSTSGGDRTMADFFAVTLDREGRMRIVFNDTTSQHHGAHLFETRQLAGSTALGGRVRDKAPSTPVSDPTGDAQWPHYVPGTGAGANQPQLDLTRADVSRPSRDTLRVQLSLADPSSLAPPPGKANAVWLLRFQALSIGDRGEEAYRIFYVGAESAGGGAPSFFAGSTTCTETTPQTCKVVQYPAQQPTSGSIDGNTITIDAPLAGFGYPIKSGTLFSVTALTFGRDAAHDLYADVDATRAVDVVLKGKP